MEVSLAAAVASLQGFVDISADARLTKMVARIFLEARRPEMAAQLLVELAVPDAEAMLILGSSLMLMKQPEAAQEAFCEALRLDPQQGLARLRYSLLLALQGRSEQALRQLQKLPPEVCEPELRQLYETLFQEWRRPRDDGGRTTEDGRRRMDDGGRINPTADCRLPTADCRLPIPEPMARLLQRHVLEVLALLLRLEEFTRFEQALPLLEAVGLSPEDQWQCLGQLYYDLHFEESSLAELLKLVHAGRATPPTYKMMGMICMRRQQYEEAETCFREALRCDLSPQPNRAYLLALTSALIAQGKRQEAEELISFISFMSAETIAVASGSIRVGS